MIPEIYIKGRFDYGVGKCAVVIVTGDEIAHKVAWKVPQSWQYNGSVVAADVYNCEITAAVYGIKWVKEHGYKVANIYANTTSCVAWYGRRDFPDSRQVMGRAYCIEADGIDVCAEYFPKSDSRTYNQLVNEMAESVK